MTGLRIVAIGLACVATGCAGKPVLESRSGIVPADIDFSGEWQLRAGQTPDASRGATSGELVRVFLETGEALRITQTDDGIFVSFDRAVVEEYRFGEHREVNVGPIVADRVSGWDGPRYIVETLDEDGVRLVETYRLIDDGQSLHRGIVIERRDKPVLEIEQTFDKR